MEAKAKLRFLRKSPKKARLLADAIRGLNVSEAQNQLRFAGKDAARPLLKLLNSAVANAENNFELDKNNLYIKEIRVDQGPTLKRWSPRAHGRATPIRKRSSHISLVLAERVPSLGKKKAKAEMAAPTTVKDLKDLPKEKEEKADELAKQSMVKETMEGPKPERPFDVRRQGKRRDLEHQDKKGMKKGVIKKLFSRKAV